MNILFLTTNTRCFGGIPRYCNDLIRALNALGHTLTIVELSAKPNALQKFLFLYKVSIAYLLSNQNIVFCAHTYISPLCYLFSILLRKEYIITVYGTEISNITKRSKIITKGLSGADTLAPISKFTKEMLKKQLNNNIHNYFLLPCTVDGNIFFPTRKRQDLVEKYNISGKKIIFTLAARLCMDDRKKGYLKIIEILPHVLKKEPNTIYLIGGGCGNKDDLPKIWKYIKNLGLERHVIFVGSIPKHELIDYHNLADVFVMPSKQEGFGIVFLEALACGKPVIAGNTDGSRDALLGGRTGILVNPDNKQEIAEAIISVIQKNVSKHLVDPEYLRSETLKHYGFDKFTDKLREMCSQYE